MGGKGGQLALVDLPEAQPEDWGAHYTVARLLDDLREFAAQALQTHDLNAQLFAEEAEKSVHLLDVFLNDYDVVVMNPPYGSTTEIAKRYLRRAYPNTQNDLYGAFIERAFKLSPQGMIGALTSRTFMFQSSFDKLRTEVLAKVGMPCLIELGLRHIRRCNSSDSGIRVSVMAKKNLLAEAAFFRLVNSDFRQDEFETALLQLAHGHHSPSAFLQNVQDFHALPDSRIAYWPSKALIAHFATQFGIGARVCKSLRGINNWRR